MAKKQVDETLVSEYDVESQIIFAFKVLWLLLLIAVWLIFSSYILVSVISL